MLLVTSCLQPAEYYLGLSHIQWLSPAAMSFGQENTLMRSSFKVSALLRSGRAECNRLIIFSL